MGSYCLIGTELLWGGHEEVLEMNSDDGCTTM